MSIWTFQEEYFPITIEFECGETKLCQSARDIPLRRAYRVIKNSAGLPNNPEFVVTATL